MSYHQTDERAGTPATNRGGRLARFMRGIIAGLDALHRARFDTPWRQEADKPRG